MQAIRVRMRCKTLQPSFFVHPLKRDGSPYVPMERQGLLMVGLTNYFQQNVAVLELLRDLLEGRSRISLRVLDYFITTYSRAHKVILCLSPDGRLVEHGDDGQKLDRVNVHNAYRSQLQAYGKAMFDPFRRRERISFAPVPGIAPISTTVGQLNCMRWLQTTGVIQYVDAHLGEIEAGMKGAEASDPASLPIVKGVQSLSFN